jgi:hypothetical protein
LVARLKKKRGVLTFTFSTFTLAPPPPKKEEQNNKGEGDWQAGPDKPVWQQNKRIFFKREKEREKKTFF